MIGLSGVGIAILDPNMHDLELCAMYGAAFQMKDCLKYIKPWRKFLFKNKILKLKDETFIKALKYEITDIIEYEKNNYPEHFIKSYVREAKDYLSNISDKSMSLELRSDLSKVFDAEPTPSVECLEKSLEKMDYLNKKQL
ncbi:Uncharacterised protein [Candidatus Tiddalikarchaeum anstoanum]|nr:Uncharacterised protein [Candidatus Tiddalikarchaeum anstoanum]